MQLNFKQMFEQFPDNSQVWVYSSDRFLSGTEEEFANEQLTAFIAQWAAHGTDLFAEFKIIDHNFIVIVADENKVKASGCSIDSSVRFIKDLGKELGINFFNRLSVLIEKDGEYKRIHFSDLSSFPDWNLYNTMAKNLSDLRGSWKSPISKSQFV